MNWVIACVFYELRPLRSEESFRQMKARTTIEYYSSASNRKPRTDDRNSESHTKY